MSFIVNAFAHDASNEYMLEYNEHFNYPHDKNMMWVRKAGRPRRSGSQNVLC